MGEGEIDLVLPWSRGEEWDENAGGHTPGDEIGAAVYADDDGPSGTGAGPETDKRSSVRCGP